MRINKYISTAGICSRREADKKILDNCVTINGIPAKLGDEVSEGDEVIVDGIRISTQQIDEKRVILIYNKPEGLICSTSNKDGKTILEKIDYPKRLFYVGRLDKASRGLMILTNDGDLANELMRSKNAHEREYIVTTETKVSDEAIKSFRKGVYLKELNKKTRPCTVKRISDKSFSIVLTQGLNKQIRRMCKENGLIVKDLCRIRIENLSLGKLKEGTYRRLKNEEKEELLKCLLESKTTYQ